MTARRVSPKSTARCKRCGATEMNQDIVELSRIRFSEVLCRGCYERAKRYGLNLAQSMTVEEQEADAERFRAAEARRAREALANEKQRIKDSGRFFHDDA